MPVYAQKSAPGVPITGGGRQAKTPSRRGIGPPGAFSPEALAMYRKIGKPGGTTLGPSGQRDALRALARQRAASKTPGFAGDAMGKAAAPKPPPPPKPQAPGFVGEAMGKAAAAKPNPVPPGIVGEMTGPVGQGGGRGQAIGPAPGTPPGKPAPQAPQPGRGAGFVGEAFGKIEPPRAPGAPGPAPSPQEVDRFQRASEQLMNEAIARNASGAGSGGDWGSFAHGLLQKLGTPDTQDNVDALFTIMNSEQAPDNPNARNNPLNIQAGGYPHEGTSPGGQYNFPTMGEGEQQTANFLQQNGVYRRILDRMAAGNDAPGVLNEWQASPWAESHYHGQLPGRLGGIQSQRDMYAGGRIRG